MYTKPKLLFSLILILFLSACQNNPVDRESIEEEKQVANETVESEDKGKEEENKSEAIEKKSQADSEVVEVDQNEQQQSDGEEIDLNKVVKENNDNPKLFEDIEQKFYIQGVTLGDPKSLVIEKLGNPDEEKEDSSELDPSDTVLSYNNLNIYITNNKVTHMNLQTNEGFFKKEFYNLYPNRQYISEDSSMFYLYEEPTGHLIYAKYDNENFMVYFDYADGNFKLNLDEQWIIKTSDQNRLVVIEQNEPTVLYNTYTNERFGFTFEYPSDFVMDEPPTNGDGITVHNNELNVTAYGGHTNVVNEGETIETYYEEDLSSINAEISYQQIKDNWYVLSYKEGNEIVYKKFFFGDSTFNTFIITYPVEKQEVYEPIVTHISDSFVPSLNE